MSELPKGDYAKDHAKFNFFFNKIAWAAIAAIAWYASSQLENMSKSINELNKNVAVMMAQMNNFSAKDLELQMQIDRLNEKLERRTGR